jgi:hypothetical protein
MKEWYGELWKKHLCKIAKDEIKERSKALATASVATDMISLNLCMKLQVTGWAMNVRRAIQARLLPLSQ